MAVQFTARPFQSSATAVQLVLGVFKCTAKPAQFAATPFQSSARAVQLVLGVFKCTATAAQLAATLFESSATAVQFSARGYKFSAKPFQTIVFLIAGLFSIIYRENRRFLAFAASGFFSC